MKRLVLIDGKSVFYRGYYAMGNLALPDGTPTGGVYGFAAIAMEIVHKLDPTKVVVAWDSKTSTSRRRSLYPEYKAGRVKPGEDFYAQIPLLEELIHDLGWAFVEIDDYEADDIIGTLSKQADQSLDSAGQCEYETYIISSDLDMLQIVDQNTHMWRILKGFTKIEQLDIKEIEKKYGIRKSQFLDLKALKGDASDNIPGVPGIGEKTAVKLLSEYDSLDSIYQNLDKITGATHAKLVAGQESAFLSRELAKIMFDAPIQLAKIPDFHFDRERVIRGLKKLEFNSLIRKISTPAPASHAPQKTAPTSPLAATTPPTPASVSTQTSPSAPISIPAPASVSTQTPPSPTTATAPILASAQTPPPAATTPAPIPQDLIIGWDIKSIMHSNDKIASAIIEKGAPFWDLSQAAFLLNPLTREEPTLVDLQEAYLTQKQQLEQIPSLYNIYTNFDLPLIPILYQMEKKGMLIDRQYFDRLKQEYVHEVHQLEQSVWQLAGTEFNLNSPIQLSEVLFIKLQLPTKGIKKTTRGYSTGAKELDKLKDTHPVIAKIIEYREAAKLLSTYITPIPNLADANSRIHTTFTQNVTATGRLSSKDPNLQNIPIRTEAGKRIRAGVIAPPGKVLVSADYSQFELRLAAVLAGDQPLIQDFNQNIDIHTKTAAEAFGVPIESVTKDQRRAAKVINFGILYGMSVKGLADAAKMPIAEAKRFIDNYFTLRAPIKTYLENLLKKAKEDGYVETAYGRRRPTPDIKSPNFVIRQAAERAAENMPIQGTEADLMKRAMISVAKALPPHAELIMQVHDSLIVECDEAISGEVAQTLQTHMESVAPELHIKLAVEVSIAKNWGEL